MSVSQSILNRFSIFKSLNDLEFNSKEGLCYAFSTKSIQIRRKILGFHDCPGGCDGCLNLDDANNKGLEKILVALEDIYWEKGYDSFVNHADFWALAATLGIEEGSSQCFDYYFWGRNECKTAPLTKASNAFPDPAMTLEQMFNYYWQEFKLQPKEVSGIFPIVGNALFLEQSL